MKRMCIPILVWLLLTACGQSASPTTPGSNAAIVAGVMGTLTAQAASPTINVQTAVVQTVSAMTTRPNSSPTLTVQAATPTQVNIQTAIAQTLTAISTRPVSPTQLPASVTAGPQNTPIPAQTPTASSTPRIWFEAVPPIGSSDPLYGKVEGVNPARYGVAVYIKVGGGWWTKPTWATPVTTINSDGTWNCPYATGGDDTSATVIRAYLIPIGYIPPTMSGGSSLPANLESNAVARVEATR